MAATPGFGLKKDEIFFWLACMSGPKKLPILDCFAWLLPLIVVSKDGQAKLCFFKMRRAEERGDPYPSSNMRHLLIYAAVGSWCSPLDPLRTSKRGLACKILNGY